MTRWLVLRVVGKEPELLDPNVIAFTEWHGFGAEESLHAIYRITVQVAKWSHRQGWLEGHASAEDE